MSSFVPHPLPHPLSIATTLPAAPRSVVEQEQNNERPLSSNALKLTSVEDSGHDLYNEQEVIMIDDITSNEGVTMENSSNEGVGLTIVSVDGSHGSAHIDLDQNDNQDDDIAVALEKFVDQSSDASSTE